MIQIQPKSLKLSWLCIVNQSVPQLETKGTFRNPFSWARFIANLSLLWWDCWRLGLRHTGACYRPEVGRKAAGREGRSAGPQTEPVPWVCLAEGQRTDCVLQNTAAVGALTASFSAQVVFPFLSNSSCFPGASLLNRNMGGAELKRRTGQDLWWKGTDTQTREGREGGRESNRGREGERESNSKY